jgi:hypothetical protein
LSICSVITSITLSNRSCSCPSSVYIQALLYKNKNGG